jgi:hypothetical protein
MANTRSLTSKSATNAISLRELITYGTDPTITTLKPSIDVGQSWDFDGTTGPAVTLWWHGLVTLTAGVATIDLTALVDALTGNTISMTGLKLKCLHLQATTGNANAITFAPGASNGYTGWGLGEVLNGGDQRGPSICTGGIAVDATHKVIDVSGTGSQSVRVVMLFG